MMDMGIPNEKAELALSETGNVGVEVATEWLFSVPDHVLEKHLASEPNTPVEAAAQNPEDHRVMLPRRVPLQVCSHSPFAERIQSYMSQHPYLALHWGSSIMTLCLCLATLLCGASNFMQVGLAWLCTVVVRSCMQMLCQDPAPKAFSLLRACLTMCSHVWCVLQHVRCVAAGGHHTVAVTDTAVCAWGSNSCGQLGTRTFKDKASPTDIKELEGTGVDNVACGAQHTLFLCRYAVLLSCG